MNATTGLIVRDTSQPVPLEHVHVEAHVADVCARVTVQQRYRNRETVSLEVVYVFPLDEGSAVCGFEATVDGVRYVGQVRERDEAFKEYDDAMEAGHGGFLLDEERADVFTASLGNVKPGSVVVLSITYVTELAAEGAGARFTLPTTVSPRYAPASDRTGVGPTPADVLNPPVALDVPYAFTFEMDVAMKGAIRTVTSPSHPIEVEHDGTRARVRLAQREAAMDRDLVILVAADGLDIPHAVVERGERGGAVLVSFVPRFESAGRPADVVFLIDRSGSMGGASIAEVRNALQLCLRSLTPGCRFNIVSFGNQYSSLFPRSRPYDEESMREASAFVGTLDADMGGTELLPAMEFVLEQAQVEGLSRQVLLLTDGEVTNTDETIGTARRHAATTRFFTFGIGAGASQHLVRGIARASGGAAEFISPGERIEAKVMRQFTRVFAPALTDVELDWGQPDVVPAFDHLPPVFDGERFTVYALLNEPRAAAATLSGTLSGRAVRFEVPVDPSAAITGSTVATLAARARIRTLEEQGDYLESRGSRQRRARTKPNVAAEIAALGVKYQLCSRETSFVAIEHRDTPVTERAELRRVPVALTTGWGGYRVMQPGAHFAAPMPTVMPMALRPMAAEANSFDDTAFELGHVSVGAAAPLPPPGRVYSARRAPQVSRLRPQDTIVGLQAANGSWDLTTEFADAVGLRLDRLEQAARSAGGDPQLAGRALATALALAWLDRNASGSRTEWLMLAEKAGRWLASCGASPSGGERWMDVATRILEERC
jgi:Ca-activated chloride channel homolog